MSKAERKTLKATPNTDRCKGCYYCIEACPVDAISVLDMVNSKGYAPTKVDHDKCIGCGACYAVCPDYVYTIE